MVMKQLTYQWMGGILYLLGFCTTFSLKASKKNLNYVRAKEDDILQNMGKTVKGGNVGRKCKCVFPGKPIHLTPLRSPCCMATTSFILMKAVLALSRGMGGGYQQGEGLGASNNTSLYVSNLPLGTDRQQVWRIIFWLVYMSRQSVVIKTVVDPSILG